MNGLSIVAAAKQHVIIFDIDSFATYFDQLG